MQTRDVRGRSIALGVLALSACTNNVTLDLPVLGEADQTLIIAIDNLSAEPDYARAFDLRKDRHPSFALRADADADLSAVALTEDVEELRLGDNVALAGDGEPIPAGRAYFSAPMRNGSRPEWSDGRGSDLVRNAQRPFGPPDCVTLRAGTPQPDLPFTGDRIVPAIIDADTTLLVEEATGIYEVSRDGPARRIEFQSPGPAHAHVWSDGPNEFFTVDRFLRISRIERDPSGAYTYVDLFPGRPVAVAAGIRRMAAGRTADGTLNLFVTTDAHHVWFFDVPANVWRSFDFLDRVRGNSVVVTGLAWIDVDRALVAPNGEAPFFATLEGSSPNDRTIVPEAIQHEVLLSAINISSAFSQPPTDQKEGWVLLAGNGPVVTRIIRQMGRGFVFFLGEIPRRHLLGLFPVEERAVVTLNVAGQLFVVQDEPENGQRCPGPTVARPGSRFLRRILDRDELLVVEHLHEGRPARLGYFTWHRPE